MYIYRDDRERKKTCPSLLYRQLFECTISLFFVVFINKLIAIIDLRFDLVFFYFDIFFYRFDE